jgi:GT2 family glycosyltransferase
MPSEKPLISVVIPAYNRRDSVLQLLTDVYRQRGVAFEVIVVDDCSPDDTVTAVTAQFSSVRVLRNSVNSGPAVARNRGIREACGEYVVGFDSDVTVPDPTVLRRVMETFRQFPRTTGLAFRLLAPDGKTEDALRWWHPVPVGRFAHERFETHYFSGTGYAFRREAMVAAGLYPEILYMHYEEVELAYRIIDCGGSIMHCPDLPVLHHANPIAQRSKIKAFYKPRNQILLALACYAWPRALAYLAPRFCYNAGMAMIHGHPGEFVRAMASAWKLAPRILASRAPLRAETWRRINLMRRADAANGQSS